jgi:hypothetical protein
MILGQISFSQDMLGQLADIWVYGSMIPLGTNGRLAYSSRPIFKVEEGAMGYRRKKKEEKNKDVDTFLTEWKISYTSILAVA